jgi:hypothetical protein
MKLDNSNKRYSKIIAGILVIVTLSIFMAVIIGFWGSSTNEQEGVPSIFPLNSNFNSGINEPTAKGPITWDDVFDTERGSFRILEAGFYDSSDTLIVDLEAGTGQFPLCIEDTDGYYFNFLVEAVGGYIPSDFNPCDYIELYQYKWYGLCDTDLLYKYKIYFDASDWVEELIGICWSEWRGIIPVDNIKEKVAGSWVDTNCMKFDSNHKPDCSGTLDKWVTVKLKASWEGCNLPAQTFCCWKKWYCLDTECGSISYVQDYGILAQDFLFDLCYDSTNSLIGTIYMHVVGGYTPCDDDTVTIWQEKPDGTLYQGIYQLSDVSWTEYEVAVHGADPEIEALMAGCCETVWVGTINFGADPILLDEDGDGTFETTTALMKLDSNHPPMCAPDKFLDKWVSVTFESKWQGCGLPSQEFTYMLVHKNLFPESPTPDKNFIASFM